MKIRALTLVLAAGILNVSGCVAIVGGTRQKIAVESKLPGVEVAVDGASCMAPCVLDVRHQLASFHMTARQNGQVVVEGPIYRRISMMGSCWDHKEKILFAPALVDVLLVVPAIVEISMGTDQYMPEKLLIEENRYLVDDPCFSKPHIGGMGKGFKGDGQE